MPDYNYSGKGGMLSGGSSGYMPSLVGTAARVGLGVATGGTSEIIAQLLNIVPSIFQSIVGGSQLNKARRFEEQYPRPEAEIAPSVEKMVSFARGRTMANDIAGGEIARNEIKGATAAGMRAASELSGGAESFGLLGRMVAGEQNQFAGMARDTAQQVYQAGGDYQQALGVKANEENRVWDWNKAQPYLSAANIAQQLRDSGTKNLFSGASNIFGSTAEAVSPDFNSTLINGKENSRNIGEMSVDELTQLIKSVKVNA